MIKFESAGFDGFEFDLPEVEKAGEFKAAKEAHGLAFFALIKTQGPDHLDSFVRELGRAEELGAVFASSNSALDSMSLPEKTRFFEGAVEAQNKAGIPVAHETHRQTALFTPWDTAALLERFPDLSITADYSHWCCVTETMLAEHADSLSICNSRAVHIHGRVGFPGGPQVNDPRAPENEQYLSVHEDWWAEIIRNRHASGARVLTFDPEFGPPGDYMPSLPYTQEPICDLWDVCQWMTSRFRGLFEEVLGTHTEEVT